MSHLSRLPEPVRRGAVLCALASAAFGFAPAAASAASIDSAAKCKLPLIGTTPAVLSVSGNIPATVPRFSPTQTVPLEVELALPNTQGTGQAISPGFRAVGVLKVRLSVTAPSGFVQTVNVIAPIDPLDVPESPVTGYGAFSYVGHGSLPPLTFDEPGVSKIAVTGFSANVQLTTTDGSPFGFGTPTKDVDGNPFADSDGDLATTDIPCRFDPPTPSVELAQVNAQVICTPVILGPNPPEEEPLSDADITSTSVRLHWGASPFVPESCKPSVESYKVTYGDKSVTVPATQLDTLITGLSPNTAYAFKIEALGQFGGGPGNSSITVNVTTDAGPTGIVKFGYSLAGATQLKTLSKGTLPLTGGIAAELTLATGAISADLTLNDTSGKLTALGFLPVSAKIGFSPSGKTTGTLIEGVLKTNSKVRIKVKEVKLFGAIPLAGGNSCQTKSLSDINLQSTQAEFAPLTGGPIAGTYKISDLNGCGALNGLVSPLTAGGGNTINLNLTPKP